MPEPTFLLHGIAGAYNFGCEAILRGTELILRDRWPSSTIKYASLTPLEDREKLHGADLEIITRNRYPKYSWRSICRKASSLAGWSWAPNIEHLEYLDSADVVLSIGGDRYTLFPDGSYSNLLLSFGKTILKKKKIFVLWGASIGPFSVNRSAEKVFAKHLATISLITAREQDTICYLKSLGITENVAPCADPAFLVFPELRQQTLPADKLRVGINLSPLSASYGAQTDRNSLIQSQAAAIAKLIKNLGVEVVLIPHVVSSRYSHDDDRRYLQALLLALPRKFADRAHISNATCFREAKEEIINCQLIIASRMHCAINAVAACVPTLFIAYSQKAFGMAKYVYGNTDYVLRINEFGSPKLLLLAQRLLSEGIRLKKAISNRIPEIQTDSMAGGHSLSRII